MKDNTLMVFAIVIFEPIDNLNYGKNSGRIFYALVMNGLKHCASHNVSVNVNQPVYLRNHVSFFSQLLDTEILLNLM